MQQITEDFLKRVEVSLPSAKASAPFIVAMIGVPGSGRTTVAKMLVAKSQGAVLVSSNSARYLLRESGMSWGENVKQVLKHAASELLKKGYGVVFDGNAADEEDRKNIAEIVSANRAKVFYIRINITPAIAKSREKAKYDDPLWVSSFGDFRVNTTEKVLENIDQRVKLHADLKSSVIPGLVGEIDNDGNLESLEGQIAAIIDKIKEG